MKKLSSKSDLSEFYGEVEEEVDDDWKVIKWRGFIWKVPSDKRAKKMGYGELMDAYKGVPIRFRPISEE